MVRCILGHLFWLAFFLFSSVNSTTASSIEKVYTIGAGDVLAISVWKDDSLTRQSVVLPDGTISFPLISSIKAEGKTLEELKGIIGIRLSKYVPDPIISVEVLRTQSLVIYVIGKANRPGRLDFVGDINVLQALAQAGGLNPYAKSGKIKIFRESENGTEVMLFDYGAVSKGKDLEQNIRLQRGDVIVVP